MSPEAPLIALPGVSDALARALLIKRACLGRQRTPRFSAGKRKTSVKKHHGNRQESRCLSRSEPGQGAAHGGNGDTPKDQSHPEGPPSDREDCHNHDGEGSGEVRDDREDARRDIVEVLLCLRNRVAGDVRGERLGEHHADGEPDVEEEHRHHPALAEEEQRARAEQRRRQQAAEEVVDAERVVVPASGCAVGEGGRRRRIAEERGGPGGELWRAPRPPAPEEPTREPERPKPRPERDQRLHSIDPSAQALASKSVAEKRYLFTPGPTPVPPEVLEAMSRPIIHHRSSDFRTILERTLARLHEIYRTDGDVLVYTASGTGGMESAISNLTRPGDRVVVVSAGHFGERWIDMARNFGCEIDAVAYEWGESPSPEDLASRLEELGGAKVVLTTHSETSTGVVADVQGLAGVAKDAGALVVVDAVSSLGAVPLETDAWGLDAVISGSQKALMTPPGLATVSISADAWEAVEHGGASRYYFDWIQTRDRQEQVDPAFTPAVSIVVGLDVALGLLLEEGLDAAFERHARLGRACRAGVKAMGLELFSPDDDRSAVVTAINAPDGIDSSELVQTLRDRQGIVLAPGQGPLKGKIFRIGHIGYYDVFDITTALAGVELVLAELGGDIERGVAITAALEAFEHSRV